MGAPIPGIAEHNRATVEWLKQFKYTHSLQRFVARHKFSVEELEFLRCHWVLIPKKKQEKGNRDKWA